MASSNGWKGVSSPVKGEKTIKPNWSQGITIFQILMFFLGIFIGSVFGLRCKRAFEYGQVYRISPWDQELLNSLGISSYPQLLINAFIVSFIASLVIQGTILGIPLIQLRKKKYAKKSYFSMIVMLVLYIDWFFFGILLWEIATDINPTSRVISTLFSFIPAGIVIGGLIAKAIVNLVPLVWGYIVLPGFNDKTLYLIKHKVKSSTPVEAG